MTATDVNGNVPLMDTQKPDIREMLRKAGRSQASIADALGISRVRVGASIDDEDPRRGKGVKSYICCLLGKDYAELWGER